MTTSVVGKPKVINWPPRRPTTVGLRALPSIHFLPFPRRYEVARYVHLVDTKFTKWSNFVREAWFIKEKWNKRSCLKPPMNADARRCSAPLIGVHRRFPTARSAELLLCGCRRQRRAVCLNLVNRFQDVIQVVAFGQEQVLSYCNRR